MLQQILREQYIHPDLLIGLDEEQKQHLFCRMREEQVRRWRIWDEQCTAAAIDATAAAAVATTPKKAAKKSVSFLSGADGEPWVWVMGEHRDDLTIEQIVQQEAIENARQLAECEAEALRQQLIECITPNCDEDIYCSVDALQKCQIKPPPPASLTANYKIGHYAKAHNNNNKFNAMVDANDVLNELNQRNASRKVAAKIAQWERRLTEERTCEILQTIKSKQLQAAKEAEENERKHEQLWKEQERKAKEAEQQIREIARKAREVHRLTASKLEIEPPYSALQAPPGVPPGKQAVLDWFKKSEISRRAGLDQLDQIEPYFHGLITRADAESLLQHQPVGTFLVRLSEKLWGYAISYKTVDKCKHYLVSGTKNNYSFLGDNQVEHKSLGDLIAYYKECPLTGGEKLIRSCPRTDDSAVRELYAKTSP